MRAALSIDLESFWHHEWLRTRRPADADDRVQQATAPLLDLLRQRGVRATFFIVGDLIDRHPDLIRRLAAEGHEIGCHTFSHRPLWQLTPAEFDAELAQFAGALARCLPDVRPRGFRAPTFSLSPATAWALQALARHGYTYDSSLFPLRTPIYGVAGAPTTPFRPAANLIDADPAAALQEWPLTVWQLGRLRLPVCGGIYLRVLPLRLIRRGLAAAARRGPVLLYLHPWELDADLPRLPLSRRERFVLYHNTGAAMQRRLRALLDAFPFQPMGEVLFSDQYSVISNQ